MVLVEYRLKKCWAAWKAANAALSNYKLLLVLFWAGPIFLVCSTLILLMAIFAGVFDRLFHWNILAIEELSQGRWEWLRLISLEHQPSVLPVLLVFAIAVGGFLFLVSRYYSPIRNDKIFREITEVSIFMSVLIFVFGAFLLAPPGSFWVQIGTIVALVIAGIGLMESMILGNRIQKIFGFHSYVKIGADIYTAAREWSNSIVSNWEISKQIEKALQSLSGRKDKKGRPIELSFCGPVTNDNMIGLLWRIGVWREIPDPPNLVLRIPRDQNTPRFAINEQEVLLASTPTDDSRDLYGFLKRDASLASVYRRLYNELAQPDSVFEQLGRHLSDESPTNPHGLGRRNLHLYIRDTILRDALPSYLSQLKHDGLNHRIEKGADLEEAALKVQRGIEYVLGQLETDQKVTLNRDTAGTIIAVESWNLGVSA